MQQKQFQIVTHVALPPCTVDKEFVHSAGACEKAYFGPLNVQRIRTYADMEIPGHNGVIKYKPLTAQSHLTMSIPHKMSSALQSKNISVAIANMSHHKLLHIQEMVIRVTARE